MLVRHDMYLYTTHLVCSKRMNGSAEAVRCSGGVSHVLRPGRNGQLTAYDAVDGYKLGADAICFRDSHKQEVPLSALTTLKFHPSID